jgi:serine acetyltransferase
MRYGDRKSEANGFRKLFYRIRQGMAWRLDCGVSRWRALIASLRGVRMGSDCLFGRCVRLQAPWRIWMGQHCTVDAYAELKCPTDQSRSGHSNISLGDHVFVGRGTIIDSNLGVTIGNNTFVAPFCFITDTNHVFASKDTLIRLQGYSYRQVTIGQDVWIAAHCVILAGVTIGDGAVVAANSTVTRDVAACSVVAGSPARIIKTTARN